MYLGRWWRWRFHRCPTCGTWAWPPVTKWVDPTWLRFVVVRAVGRLRERWSDRRRLPDMIADWCHRQVLAAHQPVMVPVDGVTMWPNGEMPWCIRCGEPWPCGTLIQADDNGTKHHKLT
jgi:hypothetical protein